MFTNCPVCNRQYRIKAAQLTAAHGLVRCGYCGELFNALERLSDKPVKQAHESLQSFQIPAQTESEGSEFQLPVKPARAVSPATTQTPAEPEPEFDVSGIFGEEEKPATSKLVKFIWLFAVFLLTVTMLLQLAWYNRDYLLQKYPELKPWVQQICDQLQCELIKYHNISSIKLLNRDVRLHPHYADTLLVNATMANRANNIQPFPNIQFSLFDTGGKIIASRIFKPVEYLDNSIHISNGMPANHPVHFVLEVTGPMQSAVSFEFRFL